jgi:hypothetical protein
VSLPKTKIRVTFDDSLESAVELFVTEISEGERWRWIGTLHDQGDHQYAYVSSDDSYRTFGTFESIVEQLLIAGMHGRL